MKLFAPLEATYEISQVGANVNITIKVPNNYLNDSRRVYPVIVDPVF